MPPATSSRSSAAVTPARPWPASPTSLPVPHDVYRLGLPFAGRWDEVINTDAGLYTGSGIGNLGAVEAVPEPMHGMAASVTLRVPPLATIWLRSAS